MPMNAAKLLLLNVLGGSAVDTAASFGVTTSGAQTLTIAGLTVSAATTVDWGDGSQDVYTGSGTRTHNYASAGTWQVRILEPLNVTVIGLDDGKFTTIDGTQIAKLVNLTSLGFGYSTVGINWTVGPSAPMPTGLTTLRFWSAPRRIWTVGASAPMPTGLTTLDLQSGAISWTVGPSAPMPTGLTTLRFRSVPGLIWTVGASAPMPTGLTSLNLNNVSGVSIVSTLDACLALTEVIIENNLSDAAQNTILSQLYAAFPSRTASNGTIDLLGGGNAVSGGILQAACPPTTTREYGFELVNDSCGVSSKHWLSVSLQTGRPEPGGTLCHTSSHH